MIRKKKIAYIISRFPLISETFILREMIALEESGWQVILNPLILQKQAVAHPEAEAWMGRAHYIPWFSAHVVAANFRAFLKRPQLYLSIFWSIVWGNRSSFKFLARALVLFPKAVCMAQIMESDAIEHIHSHYATHPALVAWIIHKLTGISYSITVHAHDIYVEKSMLEPKIRGARAIIAISDFNRKYLTAYLGNWVAEKIFVVRCGIQPERYFGRGEARNNNGQFKLLCIGSLQPYKGQSFLIDACNLLWQRGLPIHLVIIGAGELLESLSAQIQRLGLKSMIELVGAKTQQEVAQYLYDTDCYVQPSIITAEGKMEGLPVALMEALACGAPAIASSISGIPELIQENNTGWLVSPEAPQELADAIEFVFRNPEEARKRGSAGRELVLREYRLDVNIRKLISIFDEFVK